MSCRGIPNITITHVPVDQAAAMRQCSSRNSCAVPASQISVRKYPSRTSLPANEASLRRFSSKVGCNFTGNPSSARQGPSKNNRASSPTSSVPTLKKLLSQTEVRYHSLLNISPSGFTNQDIWFFFSSSLMLLPSVFYHLFTDQLLRMRSFSCGSRKVSEFSEELHTAIITVESGRAKTAIARPFIQSSDFLSW